MSNKNKKDFYGLFGCSTDPGNVKNADKTLECGEIIEKSSQDTELNSEDFDKLMEKYKKELQTKNDLKNSKVCCICFDNTPKYTCPKCTMKTCSLKCCLFHKQHFGCNGIRDRISFIPLSSYTTKDLQSDCEFLEETRNFLSTSVKNNSINNKNKKRKKL